MRDQLVADQQGSALRDTIEPLGNRVLVRPVDWEPLSDGGLYLPGDLRDRPAMGTVAAVGPGNPSRDPGEQGPVRVGDRVLFRRGAGIEVPLEGERLLLLSAASPWEDGDLLAIYRPGSL